MNEQWTSEEVAWAKECLWSGDTVEEIAEMSGRQLHDVVARIGSGKRITARAREVLQLYAAGLTHAEIDRERGQNSGRPGSASASLLNGLRHNGIPIPYRNEAMAHQRAGH